jgi:hypothetical protein
LPGTGEGGGEPEAKKYILFLPATKALFIPAVFAIGVVILAVYFFFAPDTRRALVQPGHFNQSVLVETSGDSNSNTEIPEAERKAAADAKAKADRIAARKAAEKAQAEQKVAVDAKAKADRIATQRAADAKAEERRIEMRRERKRTKVAEPPPHRIEHEPAYANFCAQYAASAVADYKRMMEIPKCHVDTGFRWQKHLDACNLVPSLMNTERAKRDAHLKQCGARRG